MKIGVFRLLDDSPHFIPINIEILILVAIWDNPFIFQGSFTISSEKTEQRKKIFVFRCECFKKNEFDIIEDEFFPEDYFFTYLYNGQQNIPLHDIDTNYTAYILKYALNITLQKLLTRPSHHLITADEVAMQAIIKKAQVIMNNPESINNNEDIGFSVRIPFHPTEALGQQAVTYLLNI